jgi:P27 family predicted phage terminase small subunit
LTPEARKEWERVVPELEQLGVVALVDRAALACYCVAWADFVEACGHLATESKVLIEDGRSKRNPWTMLKRQAEEGVRRFAAEFGLTASARVRLQGLGKQDGNDGFDDGARDARSA